METATHRCECCGEYHTFSTWRPERFSHCVFCGFSAVVPLWRISQGKPTKAEKEYWDKEEKREKAERRLRAAKPKT